jgi:hypothetical protein
VGGGVQEIRGRPGELRILGSVQLSRTIWYTGRGRARPQYRDKPESGLW